MRTRWDELRRQGGGINVPGPERMGKTFIELTCHCAFEPHGRASEMWEYVWTLKFPEMTKYWKSTKGWVLAHNAPIGMSFKGRTVEDVIKQAENFFDELEKQNVRSEK